MDCNLPGFSIHGIFQARVLKWVAIAFSDSQPYYIINFRVAKSWTRLSDFTFTFLFHALEKEMATHSNVLAWRILGRGSLVGCCLWGRTESDTTEQLHFHFSF